MKNFNQLLTFHSIIDFIGSLFSRSPGSKTACVNQSVQMEQTFLECGLPGIFTNVLRFGCAFRNDISIMKKHCLFDKIEIFCVIFYFKSQSTLILDWRVSCCIVKPFWV